MQFPSLYIVSHQNMYKCFYLLILFDGQWLCETWHLIVKHNIELNIGWGNYCVTN